MTKVPSHLELEVFTARAPMALTSIHETRAEIRLALKKLVRQYAMEDADIVVDLAADCLQLIVVGRDKRKYTHPRFLDKQELVAGTWRLYFEERFISCINGVPRARAFLPMTPNFTLDELNDASEFMDSIK